MKLGIKKNDTVKVISGGSKGRTGKVLRVDRKNMTILVEGVNLRKRHVKPSQANPQGGIEMKERPIAYSNVALAEAAKKEAAKKAPAKKSAAK